MRMKLERYIAKPITALSLTCPAAQKPWLTSGKVPGEQGVHTKELEAPRVGLKVPDLHLEHVAGLFAAVAVL